jgi:predicted alpha/beta superfamily hydrolase
LKFCVLSLLSLLCVTQAHAQLTVRLNVPPTTPDTAEIYIAGTFNNWNPKAAGYRLSNEGGIYSITLPTSQSNLVEFKFTLGSWETVETDADGRDVPNRTFNLSGTAPVTYNGAVAAWRDPRSTPERHRTITRSVSILSDTFRIPQLERTRRVWLYLPPDYAKSNKTYPVLYMQDGQNVFDAATSFAGEWSVDETLDSLHARGDWGVIVVAVDNGGARRSDEYQPFTNLQRRDWGGGDGDEYVDFIVFTLKHYIDSHYRTRTDRLNTGIGGSSLGGLISFYAAVKYPHVFGRVIAFSPAFFTNPEVYALARKLRPLKPATRFYFVSGWEETVPGHPPGLFAGPQREMVDTLKAAGFDVARDVRSLLPAEGAHSEWFWRREFPAAYQWLFK